MAANTLAVVAGDSGKDFPLRGDMAVSLDFTPDAGFKVGFRTFDTNQYTITSATGTFLQLDGSVATTLVVGGKSQLWFDLEFNVIDSRWEMARHNLKSGEVLVVVGGGGGGVGTGDRPMVELVQDANGRVYPDGSVSNNFIINANGNVKIGNPLNFQPGDKFTIVYRQDTEGSRGVSHDTLFGLPGGQEIILSTNPLGYDIIEYTTVDQGDSYIYLVKAFVASLAKVTALARIGTTEYPMLGGATGKGAFNLAKPGDTIYIIRDGVGPEATASLNGPSDDDVAAGTPVPHYVVAGVAFNGHRPVLKMLPDTRPAYAKAVLNFEAQEYVEIRDLVIRDARNADGDARGIAPNTARQYITIRNVDIINCHNGVLWGNDAFHGRVDMIDTMLDSNGLGIDGPGSNGTTKGFTHNVYAGHNDATFTMLRSSSINAVHGHNIKSRSAVTLLDQVTTYNSQNGREVNLPYGGILRANNCSFHKYSNAAQGNMFGIGEETIDANRVREYTFTNCEFAHDKTGGGQDLTFFINFDTQYAMNFIDCKFSGADALALNIDPNSSPAYVGMTTKKGIRYWPQVPPVFTFTGGPLGPVLPPGQPTNVQMTPPTN